MVDCHKEIKSFHDKHIRLSEAEQGDLRDKRDKNREKVKKGLESNDLKPHRFRSQGSYAMRTITQHHKKKYDIDDGVVFNKEDLVNKVGTVLSAYEARKKVQKALGEDKRFSKQPELRTNCIRVEYAEGYHVDIPVYRRYFEYGDEILELASTKWVESYPEKVTKWYEDIVKENSPESGTDSKQMRRLTRAIKYWANHYESWNMPSGFILSKLMEECYVPVINRDDESLYETLKVIQSRLIGNPHYVKHPILDINLAEGKEVKMDNLLDRLNIAVGSTLNILEEYECTTKQALKAWKNFFHSHDFFDGMLVGSAVFGSEPKKEASIGGNNIYA
jgi:hypothetical protein